MSCRKQITPTNLAIDDELLKQAQKLGGHSTKKETVNQALAEYIRHRKQLELLEDFGSVDIDSSYDHKKERDH